MRFLQVCTFGLVQAKFALSSLCSTFPSYLLEINIYFQIHNAQKYKAPIVKLTLKTRLLRGVADHATDVLINLNYKTSKQKIRLITPWIMLREWSQN